MSQDKELISQIFTSWGGNIFEICTTVSEKEEIAPKEKLYEGILPLSKETSHTGALFYKIFHFPLLASAAVLQRCMGSVWLNAFTSSH